MLEGAVKLADGRLLNIQLVVKYTCEQLAGHWVCLYTAGSSIYFLTSSWTLGLNIQLVVN